MAIRHHHVCYLASHALQQGGPESSTRDLCKYWAQEYEQTTEMQILNKQTMLTSTPDEGWQNQLFGNPRNLRLTRERVLWEFHSRKV